MFDRQSFSYAFYRTCHQGFQQMSPESQECLMQSVAASQGPGGLFCGRVRRSREDRGREGAGQEDLYYTFFGLMLAAVTNAKIRRKDCAAKLKSMDFATLDLVHACAWLRAGKILRWLAVPRFLRNRLPAWFVDFTQSRIANKDGMVFLCSYPYQWSFPECASVYPAGKRTPTKHCADFSTGFGIFKNLCELGDSASLRETFPQQDANSPYSRFLMGTLCTDFGQPMPECNLDAYRLPNGLYANLKQHADYGVNATAAALFLLPNESCDETADALLALQEADGSFKAVASAPEGDVMSTATAAFALHRCGKSLRVSVKPFLRECFRDNGFFAATPLDPDGDLEYTAYGLLMMGLLT